MFVEHSLRLIFLVIIWIEIYLAQQIILHDLNRSDCHTQCQKGWLLDTDYCIFRSTITLNKSLTDTTAAFFYFKEPWRTSFTELFNIHMETECYKYVNTSIGNYHCLALEENVYNVTIKEKAKPRFNCTKIKGTLNPSGGNTVKTRIQEFPQLFSPTDASGNLTINEQNISTEESCNTTINDKELRIEFSCTSSAKPCVIEIAVNDSVVVHQTDDRAVFKETYKSGLQLFITIKFAGCRLDGKHNNRTCLITTEFNETSIDDDLQSSNTSPIGGLIGSVITLTLIVIVLAIVFIYYKRNNASNCCNKASIYKVPTHDDNETL
ncbi:unnamed protein product [Lymnaea stagnalis]|uniref:Uncharacterized protein n=1 Tax=Lymnaea stagnalis TaxID=6523 RepID=A0AAV2HPA4_LYMST